MKLKNVAARGSKMAVKGEVKVVGDDGTVEIDDAALCEALVSQGWQKVDAKSVAMPKKNEPVVPMPVVPMPVVVEPKEEKAKKEDSGTVQKTEEPKADKTEPKKEEHKSKRDRPKFRRGE